MLLYSLLVPHSYYSLEKLIKTALLIGPRVQSPSSSATIEDWDGDATNRRIGMMRVKMLSCGPIGTQYVAGSISGQDEDIELMEAI
jgi:hypothetical protein